MDEPTRTASEPNRMAASKSALMPMESVSASRSSPSSRCTSASRAASRTKSGWSSDAMASGFPIVIRPSNRSAGHCDTMNRASATTSLGSTPDLVSSPDVFTWTRTPKTGRPRAAASRLSVRASFSELTDSICARPGTLSSALTLLLWSEPIMCHRMSPGSCSALSTSSWT
eukprot:Amastigsp_a177873_35.p4 type:complete len:171 gc:universal Amastigsp_a177873_35:897-385(-)